MRGLVVALVLLQAARASAIDLHLGKENLRLDITESLFLAYHGDLGGLEIEHDINNKPQPENHFWDLLNRLNVALAWREWRLFFRGDTSLYFDTPDTSGKTQDRSPFSVACDPMAASTFRNRYCAHYFYYSNQAGGPAIGQIGLEYSSRKLDATLGDFYVSFGRGLVLSLRKLDELGIDTTLLGGKLLYHEGNVGATLVVGATNIQNVDEATGRFAPDPFDAIAGGRFEYNAGPVIVGLHATGGVMHKNLSPAMQLRPDGMYMYGATLDAPRLTKWLSLYFEADGQMAVQADKRSNAYAIYGAATGYFGPVSVLVEVKHYASFQRWRSSVDSSLAEFQPVAYNQPPTAERLVTELVAPIYDVSGPRIRAEWQVNRWLQLNASYAWFEDRGAGDLYYHDPYAEVRVRWQDGRSHAFVSGGYRLEECGPNSAPSCTQLTRDQMKAQMMGGMVPPHGAGEYQSIGHVEWDALQVLPARLSLETQGQALFRHGERELNPDGSVGSWTEGDAYLALKWARYLIFAGGLEWSTRPSSTKLNQLFPNGAVQWNITSASSIRLFVGGTRGGLKCISGVCRDFPAFTGARLEVVVRL